MSPSYAEVVWGHFLVGSWSRMTNPTTPGLSITYRENKSTKEKWKKKQKQNKTTQMLFKLLTGFKTEVGFLKYPL